MIVMRSYQNEVVIPLKKIAEENSFINALTIGGDLYRVVVDNGKSLPKKDVLLSAGVHGDEPAGVYALLKFLKEEVNPYLDDFRFFIYSCVGSRGFEANTRNNPENININRSFANPAGSRESQIIQDSLLEGPKNYAFTLDMHEDDPNILTSEELEEGVSKEDLPREFYLYEICEDKGKRLGRKVIEHLKKFNIPICNKDFIHKDKNNGGVISYPEGFLNTTYAQMTTLEGYLFKNYTKHAFTTETMGNWDLEKRVWVQLEVLKFILEKHRNL